MPSSFSVRHCLIVAVLALWCCCVPVRCSYNVTQSSVPDYGWEFTLQKNGDGPYGDDISSLTLSVYCDAPHRIRIIIRDASTERWEVPAFLRPVPLSPPSSPCTDTLYKFTSTLVDGVSGFRVRRAATETLLFDTASSSLVYSPQYIELSSSLPSGHLLFGLGQRLQSLRLPPAVYTMWNVDNGTSPQRNMYGSHPAYWRIEDDGNVHAVVMYNSNAMDVVLAEQSITYRMTGGVVDLYLLLGPTPADVAEQYTQLVGRPWLPPLWSLGFHTCRWGLENISYTRAMVEDYAAADMPLDTVWHDIDYMAYYADFTFDSNRFGTEQLRAFNSMLASRTQHHVYIVDPGIPALLTTASNNPYLPYLQGRDADVFIRHPSNDSALFACVWPSVPVAFPDFSHPAALEWWARQISQWTFDVGLPSGLWLDMNEISSFVQGELLPADGASCLAHEPEGPTWSNLTLTPPPYQPGVAPEAHYHNASTAASDIPLPPYSPGGMDLAARSLNTSAILRLSQFYNLHNLYGQLEQRVSRLAMQQLLQQRDDRPTRAFTLSRATFLGSGREGAAWTGDHDGGWADLAGQVVMLQQMGLHGVTMVGSDLCGLGALDSTGDDGGAEVCARWLQLGSLSPFARLHYQDWDTSRHREPYAWPEPALSMNRRSLQLRYSLLLYLSSLSVEASRTGRPLWRPMFFEFVNDSETWQLDAQLMVGPALLFPPVTQPQQQHVQVYLPDENWFDFHTGAVVYSPPAAAGQTASGVVMNIPAPYAVGADVPLLQRGGSIIVTQTPALTTAATVLNPLIVRIALDVTGQARGAVYLEDGISLDNVDRGDFHVIVFDAQLNVTAPFSSDLPLSGLLTVWGFSRDARYNISGYSIASIAVLGITQAAGALNLTLGGGPLGRSCLQLNSSAVSYTGSALLITPPSGLLTLTAPFTLSFNDGCVLPLPDPGSSLLAPVVVLVLMVIGIITLLVWLRLRKNRLAREEVSVISRLEPQPVSVIVTHSIGTAGEDSSTTLPYALLGKDEAVIKKRRRKAGSRTPTGRAPKTDHAGLRDSLLGNDAQQPLPAPG